MDDFESIFKALYTDNVWQNYHALYNDRCCQISIDYLKDHNPEVNFNDNADLILAINAIQERLKKIDDKLKNEMLLVENEEMLSQNISDAEKELIKLAFTESIDTVIPLVKKLLLILDNLRFPWRKDIKLDLKLLQLNPEKNNFYKRMWLSDFNIAIAKEGLS